MALTVAIVGSGPAGFYTADALLSAGVDVEVDIIERLPTPYGLIRGGVAPDHQTTKKVAKKFEKTALGDGIRYFGNVEVGRDVTLDELITHVTIHEFAHHFGWSDDDIAAIDRWWE